MAISGTQLGGQRMPEVVTELEQLQREIECCGKNVDELSQRLVSVLRPEPPSIASSEKEQTCSTSLAQELRIKVNMLKALANQINSIISRIEL